MILIDKEEQGCSSVKDKNQRVTRVRYIYDIYKSKIAHEIAR
jgi:hypothetical protein